jgi:hypothetical protein
VTSIGNRSRAARENPEPAPSLRHANPITPKDEARERALQAG